MYVVGGTRMLPVRSRGAALIELSTLGHSTAKKWLGTEINLVLMRKYLSLPTTCTPRRCPDGVTIERQCDAGASNSDLIARCMFCVARGCFLLKTAALP